MALMDRYRGSQLIQAGIIGVTVMILVDHRGLQPERLLQYATGIKYQALFTEAGGLIEGNDVTVSGTVGTVSSIELENGDALVTFTIAGRRRSARKPPRTSAPEPCSASVLALESSGSGTLDHKSLFRCRAHLRRTP